MDDRILDLPNPPPDSEEVNEYLLDPGEKPPEPRAGFVRLHLYWAEDKESRKIRVRTVDRLTKNKATA